MQERLSENFLRKMRSENVAGLGGRVLVFLLLRQRAECSKTFLPAPVRHVRQAQLADVITAGPGSLCTSVISNLLVDGIASTMSGIRAVRIYIENLMTEAGRPTATRLRINSTPFAET
jgi:2-phospho-L-lactate transferase/gluconeogenesis factor (CofD/UPF0052 family)